MQITVNREGQVFGPYSAEEAAAHIATGGLLPTDWAGTPGMTDWKPLSEVLATLQIPPPVPPPIPPQPAAPEPEVDPYATITTPKPPKQ